MTWYVVSERADRTRVSTPTNDLYKAIKLRNDLLAKGIEARVEDASGNAVDFTVTKHAPKKG